MSQNYNYPTSSTVTLTGSPNNAPIPSTSILVAGENPSGNQTVLQLDASGHLKVDISSSSAAPLLTSDAADGAIGFAVPSTAILAGTRLPNGSLSPLLSNGNGYLQVDLIAQTLSAVNTNIAAFGNTTVTIGQNISAASMPVVIASDQSTLPISAVSLPLPTGASTSALQTQISGQLPATLGTKLIATSLAVNIASDQVVPVSATALPLPSGAATSALQTTGNASLSSIDGKTPALGQALAAASVPVVLPAAQIATLTPLSSVTVTQATGTNLHTVVDSGTVSAKASTPTAGTVTQAALTIGTSAIRLTVSGSAPSATRSVLVFNPDAASTAKFYIGSSSVTATGGTRGIQIVAGQSFIANSDAGDYYIISDTAAQTGYVMEQA